MKLKHGWSANFIDASQRIVLTKPGRQNRLTLQWQPPFLKPIDAVSGVLLTGLTTSIGDDVRGPLLKAARERWA